MKIHRPHLREITGFWFSLGRSEWGCLTIQGQTETEVTGTIRGSLLVYQELYEFSKPQDLIEHLATAPTLED
jgi:hypothetical protein